jgi:hypothetical protein
MKKSTAPISWAEAKSRLLQSGKITEKGLAKAKEELDADPEIQAARRGESVHRLTAN